MIYLRLFYSLLGTIVFLACCRSAHGAISIQPEPATFIDGDGFEIAEGVAFSPSGHCLAVAWAKDDAIALYKRIGESKYHTKPSCVIQDTRHLGFAHDLAFSPCGRYLAIASREAHKVVLYKMENSEECRLEREPSYILEMPNCYPSSLCFSPDGQLLAICNRMGGHGITLFRMLAEGVEQIPSLEISEAKLLEYGLSAPHGIAFLPDSKSIAVVHKRFYKTKEARGDSALAIIDVGSQNPSWIDFYASSVALHSVDCHPTDSSLVVVDELSMVAIYDRAEGNQFRHRLDVPMHLQGGTEKGSRGVAFSLDGKSLAVTTRAPSVIIYAVSVD